MNNKFLIREMQFPRIPVQKYERYLPTAFDDSLTMLEKVNKLIERLQSLEVITDDLVKKWNDFMSWVVEEGLKDLVNEKLEEWLNDGTLSDIISEQILGEIEGRIENLEEEFQTLLQLFEEFKVEIQNEINALVEYVDSSLEEIYSYIDGKLVVKENVVLTVGENRQFQTLKECIEYILLLPIQPQSIDVVMHNGYELKQQIILEDVDLRHVKIRKEDVMNGLPVVLETDICIRYGVNPEFETIPAFYGKNSFMPNLISSLIYVDPSINSNNCKDCKTISSGILLDNSNMVLGDIQYESWNVGGAINFPFDGVSIVNGSNLVAHYCDFFNNGNRNQLEEHGDNQNWFGCGVRVYNSNLSANFARADRAGDVGFNISQGSTANINNSRASNCGHHGLQATSSSIVSARDCIFDDVIDDAVVAYASSKIDLRNSSCNRVKTNFGVIATRSSEINFEGGVANDCGQHGIMANRGSVIDATSVEVIGSKSHGVHASNGSIINLTSSQIIGSSGDGIHSTHGSIIQIRNSDIIGNDRYGVLAYCAEIIGNEVQIIGNSHEGAFATRGAYIVLNDSVLDGNANNSEASAHVYSFGSDVHLNNSNIDGQHTVAVYSTQGANVRAYNIESEQALGYNIFNGATISCRDVNGTFNRPINTLSKHGYILADE